MINACHDLSEGGLAVAAAEMVMAGECGIEMNLANVPTQNLTRNDVTLFSESNSRFLVEVSQKSKKKFETLMKSTSFSSIGRVTKSTDLRIRGLTGEIVVEASLHDLMRSWKATLGPRI
jgi:phosphoribosylformylglycinamidine synthase